MRFSKPLMLMLPWRKILAGHPEYRQGPRAASNVASEWTVRRALREVEMMNPLSVAHNGEEALALGTVTLTAGDLVTVVGTGAEIGALPVGHLRLVAQRHRRRGDGPLVDLRRILHDFVRRVIGHTVGRGREAGMGRRGAVTGDAVLVDEAVDRARGG